jgi:hypothetical protein
VPIIVTPDEQSDLRPAGGRTGRRERRSRTPRGRRAQAGGSLTEATEREDLVRRFGGAVSGALCAVRSVCALAAMIPTHSRSRSRPRLEHLQVSRAR